MKILRTAFFLFIIISLSKKASSQQSVEYKRSSIRTYIGAGLNEGKRETGIGLVYSIGWQKANKRNNRLHINPQLTIGGFQPLFITDLGTQRTRITNLSLNAHYDFLRLKSISFIVSGGIFGNYSRGILGNNSYTQHKDFIAGRPTNTRPEYFHTFYYGGATSLGLRINAKRVNYVVRPINIFIGNKGMSLGFASFGLDIKLRK